MLRYSRAKCQNSEYGTPIIKTETTRVRDILAPKFTQVSNEAALSLVRSMKTESPWWRNVCVVSETISLFSERKYNEAASYMPLQFCRLTSSLAIGAIFLVRRQ